MQLSSHFTDKETEAKEARCCLVTHTAGGQTKVRTWICLSSEPCPLSSPVGGLTPILFQGHRHTWIQGFSLGYASTCYTRPHCCSHIQPLKGLDRHAAPLPKGALFQSCSIPLYTLISTHFLLLMSISDSTWVMNTFRVSQWASSATMKAGRC